MRSRGSAMKPCAKPLPIRRSGGFRHDAPLSYSPRFVPYGLHDPVPSLVPAHRSHGSEEGRRYGTRRNFRNLPRRRNTANRPPRGDCMTDTLLSDRPLDRVADFPAIPAGWAYLDTAATAQKPTSVVDA